MTEQPIAVTYRIEVGNVEGHNEQYNEFNILLYNLLDNYKEILSAYRDDHYNDGELSQKIL